MSVSETRGRVQVAPDSWIWQWYQIWARRANKHRTVVDLCHFMRVVLIFGPWRWFWTNDRKLPPWIITSTLFITIGLVTLYRKFTDTMVFITITFVVTMFIAGVLAGIVYSIARWTNSNPEQANMVLEKIVDVILVGIVYGTIWLWWPLWQFGRGIAWFWRHVLDRPFERIFWQPLFYVSIRSQLIGVWIYTLFAAAVYITAFVLAPKAVLIMTWGAVLATTLIIGIVLMVVWLNNARKRRIASQLRVVRLATSAEEKAIKERRAKKERQWRTVKLFWTWAVAKKHRVCPLIETKPPTFEPPKTPFNV